MATKKPVVIETTLADLWSQFQTGDTLDVNGALTVNDAGGDFDTRIEGDTATNLFVTDAGLDAVQIGGTVAGSIADFRAANIVLNEAGADLDVRIEGDTATLLFVCDAGLDAVRIGTTVAGEIADFRSAIVVLNESGRDQDLRVEGDTATSLFVCDAGLDAVQIGGTTAGTIADFRATAVVFNETGNDQDFRVEGDTSPQLFVCDAGSNSVQAGNTFAGEYMNLTSTVAEFNNIGSDIDFRVSGSILGSPAAFVVDSGLGAVRFGTIVDGDIFDARNGFWTVNEAGADFDTRIEGDTLTHLFYTEGNASSENICMLGAALPAWNSMDRGLFIGNMTTAPTGNPTSGIYAWVDGDAFNIQNPSGTVRNLFSASGADKLGLTGTATKTANYTAAVGDLVRCSTSGGAFTVTMPASPAAGDVVGVTLVTAGSDLTIARDGSQTFNCSNNAAATSLILDNVGSTMLFMYSATNEWTVIADTRELRPVVTIFTADGTYTPDPRTVYYDVHAVGGGGGGGAGRRGATSTNRCGGGGGGGGEYRAARLTAATVGLSNVTVDMGAGGSGGVYSGTNSTNGGNGGAGGNSSFGAHVVATGGSAGTGGSTSAGSGGAGGTGGTGSLASAAGGAGGNGASGGANGTSGSGGATTQAGAGGGGGWGLSSDNATVRTGGFGGTGAGLGGPWGTASLIDGYDGQTAIPIVGPGYFAATGGGGGGGGSASFTVPTSVFVCNAGRGAGYGGGGGGGGGTTDSTSSFANGQVGANGVVVVIAYLVG